MLVERQIFMINRIKNKSRKYFNKERKLKSFARRQIDLKYSRGVKRSLNQLSNISVKSPTFTNYKVYDLVR